MDGVSASGTVTAAKGPDGMRLSYKDGILAAGKVEPSRVFIRWPKDLSPAKKDGIRESRVEFVLQ